MVVVAFEAVVAVVDEREVTGDLTDEMFAASAAEGLPDSSVDSSASVAASGH